MSATKINRDSYNLVAANYAHEHGAKLVWQPELDKFIAYLNSPKRVVDLGCGHGDETIYLAEKLPKTKVVGVDFAEAMIQLAKSKSEAAEFVIADITGFIADSKVQGIWARASFHHLNDAELRKLFQHIKSYVGDSAVICMVNKLGKTEEIEEKQKYGMLLKRYFNYFDPDKVQKIAQEHGFEIIEQYVKPEGEHQFLVSYLRNTKMS